jgi:phosphoribulokinase
MPRPVILGVVGDSAAGKTTITRGLVRILGEDRVTHVGLDDYHRYDRSQRAERKITPLRPDANYMDIMTQHLRHLRGGDAILKPVYRHTDGTFGPPKYVEPHAFAVVEGLLGYHTDELCDLYDVRVYLAPPEELRRRWKVDRDCSRRGYTTDEVLRELDRREPDSAAFIRPQQRRADMVVSFEPSQDGGEALDARLILRPDLPHPDLSPVIDAGRTDIAVDQRGEERHLHLRGDIEPDQAAAIEEAVWEKMHFASHLRTERLGEYTIGTELLRSETLAIVQLLILYHLATAKAAVALGGNGTRRLVAPAPAAEAVAG